jgi:hypothetical protein
MRSILRALILLLLATGVAQAQTAADIRIVVSGFTVSAAGGEKHAGATRGVVLDPSSFGTRTSGIFSTFDCGYFAVTVPPGAFHENARAGWRIEITPAKVAADHAVTFRLLWVRALDTGRESGPPGADQELTLKPGESRQLDSVPVPANSKTIDGRPCNVDTAALRVAVEFDPSERRLIGADVWLVERFPNGKEESQLQSVRSLPHRSVPFYFDSISDGASRFDIFGSLVAELEQGGIAISVEATRGRADPGQKGYQAARHFRSTIHVKPGEIVEVALTTPSNQPVEPSNRQLSLRIRARHIR